MDALWQTVEKIAEKVPPHVGWKSVALRDYFEEKPLRIVVFGSFWRGWHLIRALEECWPQGSGLQGRKLPFLQVVGVVTDDPSNSFISGGKRVWRYEDAMLQKDLVPNAVAEANQKRSEEDAIRLWTDRVKTPQFDAFIAGLQPDMAIMGTFGQKIDAKRKALFPCGFYNCHPVGDMIWPHPRDAGPQPYEAMIDRATQATRICFHDVDPDGLDTGEALFFSRQEPLNPGTRVPDLHQQTSHLAAETMSAFFLHTLFGLLPGRLFQREMTI